MREPALPDVTAKRRYVADLEIGESVDTVFLLSEHHPGKTKNDDWYLRTKFSDKSGTIAGIMWSDSGAEEAAKTAAAATLHAWQKMHDLHWYPKSII